MSATLTLSSENFPRPSAALIGNMSELADAESLELAKRNRIVANNSLVRESDRLAALNVITKQIRGLQGLQNNWDTYGARPTSQKSVNFSIELLCLLRPNADIPPPTATPISGGVFLEWRTPDTRVYFEVDDRSIVFAAEHDGILVETGEDELYDASRAHDLLNRVF